MEKLLDEAKAALHTLPAGPWMAFGTMIYAGKTLVAQSARGGPEGEKIAQVLARLPDLIHLLVTTAPDELSRRVEAQAEEIEELKAIIDGIGGVDLYETCNSRE